MLECPEPETGAISVWVCAWMVEWEASALIKRAKEIQPVLKQEQTACLVKLEE